MTAQAQGRDGGPDLTGPLWPAGEVLPGYRPAGPLMWVVRVAVAVGILLGMVQQAHEPAARTVGDLLVALERGTVSTVRIERPPAQWQPSGQFRVEWQADGERPAYAFYMHGSDTEGEPLDEGAHILTAVTSSPRDVALTVERELVPGSGVTWGIAGLAGLAALCLLLAGPQPRHATRWAWFWMFLIVASPVIPLAFVLLEPVPLWRRRTLGPAHRRVTGGWAFLLVLVLGPLVHDAVEANVDRLVWGWR